MAVGVIGYLGGLCNENKRWATFVVKLDQIRVYPCSRKRERRLRRGNVSGALLGIRKEAIPRYLLPLLTSPLLASCALVSRRVTAAYLYVYQQLDRTHKSRGARFIGRLSVPTPRRRRR